MSSSSAATKNNIAVATAADACSLPANHVDVVDPSNAVYDASQSFIVRKTDKRSSFTIMTPPLIANYVRLTLEGNLLDGTDFQAKARWAAKFSAKLEMNAVDADLLAKHPHLYAQMRRFFVKLRATERAVLTDIYEKCPPAWEAVIKRRKVEALNEELASEKKHAAKSGTAPAYMTLAALRAAMAADPVLNARMEAEQLETFLAVEYAKKNPDEFDEEGYKAIDEDAGVTKADRLSVNIKRKVWAQKGKYVSGKEIPEPPAVQVGTLENWAEVLEALAEYRYQPFEVCPYAEIAKPAAQRKAFKRPTYTPPGAAAPVDDPTWSKIKKSSLVSIELSFQAKPPKNSESNNYGLHVVPIRQLFWLTDLATAEEQGGSDEYADIATGVDAADLAPVATLKRPKTEPVADVDVDVPLAKKPRVETSDADGAAAPAAAVDDDADDDDDDDDDDDEDADE